MIRALSLTCLAVFALPAVADAKPQICILGLEVKDNGAGMTQEDAKVATELTSGLRTRAKVPNGAYEWAGKQGDRELVDLTMAQGCSDTDDACMTKIGDQLSCDVLMFGSISKDAGGKGAYTVRLRLLSMKSTNTAKAKSVVQPIPISEASNASKLQGWANKLYRSATGQSSLGVLVVKTNVDRGTVLINGDVKGNITNGEATIEGLTAARYTLAIEASGYERYEKQVQVEDDKTKTETIELKKTGGGEIKVPDGNGNGHRDGIVKDTTRPSTGPWKSVAIGSAVATGVLAIGFGVSWYELSLTGKNPTGGPFSYGQKCPMSGGGPSQCGAGPALNVTTYITAFGLAAAAGFTVWAIIKVKSDSHGNEHARRGHRPPKPDVVVTPVISPDGAGATLRFDW